MSPEQALASATEIDARSDVFAMGAMLFTLVSGAMAHRGENVAQIMVSAATLQARSLAEVAPHAPTSLVSVVDRALAFDKDTRWSSAAEMRDALVDAQTASGRAPHADEEELARFVARLVPPSPADDDPHPARIPDLPRSAAMLTETPVSSPAPTMVSASRPRRTWLWPAAGAVSLALLMGIAIGVAARGKTAAAPVNVAPPSAAGLEVSLPSFESNQAPAADPEPPPTGGTPSAPPPPRASPPRPKSVAPAAPKPPGSTHSCTPPYYIDGAGEKHFYSDCF
jgi:serine/threonine-protein kinase